LAYRLANANGKAMEGKSGMGWYMYISEVSKTEREEQ
jgi:hypothetical protein